MNTKEGSETNKKIIASTLGWATCRGQEQPKLKEEREDKL